MKIALDARFLGPEGTGIGKYTEQLIENLQILDTKNEYKILLRKNNFELFKPKNRNFQKVLADSRWYTLKEQIAIPAVLNSLKPDLVHFPHFNVPLLYPGKFVVTVHDITKSEFKNTASTTHRRPVYLLKHAGYELVLNQSVRRAKHILVPSNAVKDKIIKYLKVKPEKIVVTYESADEVYLNKGKTKISEAEKKKILSRWGITNPFVLYVGNAYEYKNLGIVLEALKILNKELDFVHVTKKDFFTEEIQTESKKLGLEENYKITGFVEAAELASLYKLAEALVFPSLSEGFGLPGLEAMASGCPVLASEIPVFKEIYGSAAEYFNPKEPKDLAKKIQLVINDQKLANSLIKKGNDQVKKYSWRKTAQETLKVYNSL